LLRRNERTLSPLVAVDQTFSHEIAPGEEQIFLSPVAILPGNGAFG
jgi:hypothetical protein